MCHWAVQREHKDKQQNHNLHNLAQSFQTLVSPAPSLLRAEKNVQAALQLKRDQLWLVLPVTPPEPLPFKTWGAGVGSFAYKYRARLTPPSPIPAIATH